MKNVEEKIIDHIRAVYEREGEEGLQRHVSELIKLIEDAAEAKKRAALDQ